MMERVKTLVEKLNNQLAGNTPVQQLLFTVQMLHNELSTLQVTESPNDSSVSLFAPVIVEKEVFSQESVHSAADDVETEAKNTEEYIPLEIVEPLKVSQAEEPQEVEEKVYEVLQVDEAELEAELEEIKRKADEMNNMAAKSKPVLHFETDEADVLEQYKHSPHIPLNYDHPQKSQPVKELFDDNDSLNDKLRQSHTELSEHLGDAPIKDLKKAIGINERFIFINELFKGDETMYERSIKTINHFTIYAEAEYFIRRELKLKLVWDENDPLVQQFDQLVRRRFSHR